MAGKGVSEPVSGFLPKSYIYMGILESQVGAAGPCGSLVLLVAFIGIIELCSL